MPRAATELAKEWRTDRVLRRLEAMLAVVDAQHTLLVTGNGDVIQPTDGVLGIGSGGQLCRGGGPGAGGPQRPHGRRRSSARRWRSPPRSTSTPTRTSWWRSLACAELTPREIVAELDRHIVGQQDEAKRAVAVAIRNRWRRQQLPEDMRQEVAPKNIMMIGPTGVGKTEIARRLAKLTGAPFIKVEATKYTEVGYYGRDVESMVRELVENAIGLVRQTEQGSGRERGPPARRRAALGSAGPRRRRSPDAARRQPRFARALRADAARRCGRCWPPASWTSAAWRSRPSRRRCR